MLDYTKAAFNKIIGDFRKIANGIKITTQLLSIVYLIYALFTNKKLPIQIANAVLLALAIGYFVFFFIVEMRKGRKELKRLVKEIYGWSKRSIKFFTIGITVYGLIVAKIEFDPLSFLLVVLMVIGWVLELLFYIIIKFLDAEKTFLLDAVKSDLANVPILGGHILKKMDAEAPKEENLNKLESMVQQAREKRALEKQQAKTEKKENAKLLKAQKTEEKRQLKAAKRAPAIQAPEKEEPKKEKRKK